MNLDNRLVSGEGALLAISGYNPILRSNLPDGLTAEYYGDDVLYFAWKKDIIAMVLDFGKNGVEFRKENADRAPREIWEAIDRYVEYMCVAIDHNANFPIEAWAEKWL